MIEKKLTSKYDMILIKKSSIDMVWTFLKVLVWSLKYLFDIKTFK